MSSWHFRPIASKAKRRERDNQREGKMEHVKEKGYEREKERERERDRNRDREREASPNNGYRENSSYRNEQGYERDMRDTRENHLSRHPFPYHGDRRDQDEYRTWPYPMPYYYTDHGPMPALLPSFAPTGYSGYPSLPPSMPFSHPMNALPSPRSSTNAHCDTPAPCKCSLSRTFLDCL